MKTLITAAALLAAATTTFASEYTNFDIQPGTLTRAEVRAQIAAPQGNDVVRVGDATEFRLPAATSTHGVSRYASTPPSQRINTRNASYQSADLAGRI